MMKKLFLLCALTTFVSPLLVAGGKICPPKQCPTGTNQFILCGRANVCCPTSGNGFVGTPDTQANTLTITFSSGCIPADAAVVGTFETDKPGNQNVTVQSRVINTITNTLVSVTFNYNSKACPGNIDCSITPPPNFWINFIVCGCSAAGCQ